MREIVLDTETTGLDPLTGHRIVEVGCIEIENLVATGRSFQAYFNPEREMPQGAMDVHGLSDAFLSDKPLFAERVEEMLTFIGDAQLVIHNAQFDLGFLNAELERAGRTRLTNPHIDTVSLARRKFPGQRASLDALCERFGVENSHRTKHGALLDAELLAEVYLELSGGRQRDLGLAPEIQVSFGGATDSPALPVRAPRPFPVSVVELAAHAEFLEKKLSDPLWLKA